MKLYVKTKISFLLKRIFFNNCEHSRDPITHKNMYLRIVQLRHLELRFPLLRHKMSSRNLGFFFTHMQKAIIIYREKNAWKLCKLHHQQLTYEMPDLPATISGARGDLVLPVREDADYGSREPVCQLPHQQDHPS